MMRFLRANRFPFLFAGSAALAAWSEPWVISLAWIVWTACHIMDLRERVAKSLVESLEYEMSWRPNLDPHDKTDSEISSDGLFVREGLPREQQLVVVRTCALVGRMFSGLGR